MVLIWKVAMYMVESDLNVTHPVGNCFQRLVFNTAIPRQAACYSITNQSHVNVLAFTNSTNLYLCQFEIFDITDFGPSTDLVQSFE